MKPGSWLRILIRLLALIRKEIIQVLRDPISLMIMFAMPGFLLILFGVAISLDVDRIKLVAWDLDDTVSSRELIRRFTGSGYFSIVARADNDREIQRLIDSGEASVSIKIPPDFEENLDAARLSPVRIMVDGSDNNTASVTLSYVELILQEYSTERLLESLRRRGVSTGRMVLPVQLEPRILYNPELLSENFFVPGLMGMVMMVTTTVLTTLSIVREKERGTIEMLMVSPLSRAELVLGKICPYFVISFINLFILLFLGMELFDVPFRGNLGLFAAVSALFLLTALGYGVLISTLASSTQVAWTISFLSTLLPSFILSGFIFPIEGMPRGIQMFTYLVPVRYYIVILRGIILKGVGVESLSPQILSLAVFAVVMIMVSSRRVARRLK